MPMQTAITEQSRELPISGDYDVVVAGGGIAGVAAALAAARAGASVCLLEKACALGGLATIGNIIVYLPLCDGLGHQVSGGICEELLKLSVSDITEPLPNLHIKPIPEAWQKGGNLEERRNVRYRANYNPITFSYKLERLLLKNKVKIFFDSRFCTVIKEQNRIVAVVIENQDGRTALRCQAVVDASGSADVCYQAGEKTVSLSSNVLCGWFYYVENGEVRLCTMTKSLDMNGRRNPAAGRNYRGDRSSEVNDFLLNSRKMMMDTMAQRSQENNSQIYPILAPQMPSFRMIRRLAGRHTLRESDDRRWFEDTLGMTGDWRLSGPVYCLPLSILAGVRNHNLITAGRCISSAGRAWDVTRVIPTCAVSGEAAGAAAAFLALDKLPSFQDLDCRSLQTYLRRRRVIIDRKRLQNT
jgi:hypothetical protein